MQSKVASQISLQSADQAWKNDKSFSLDLKSAALKSVHVVWLYRDLFAKCSEIKISV